MNNNVPAWNFATWTSLNLAHCVDFLRSIMEQHGDLRGDYDSLSEITKALETNIRYAEETKERYETRYTPTRSNEQCQKS